MTCIHPDHNDQETCLERAVGCDRDCTCCMGVYTLVPLRTLSPRAPYTSELAREILGRPYA